MNIEIRPVLRRDRPGVLRIIKAVPEFSPIDEDIAQEVLDACLNDPVNSGYSTLVACNGGFVYGYICYGQTPLTQNTWDIYWQAVDPAKQGKGIGSALTKKAEHDIRTRNGKLVVIETSSRPEYEKTLRFHLHQGYEIVARIPDFYNEGDDKLILIKRLKHTQGRTAGR